MTAPLRTIVMLAEALEKSLGPKLSKPDRQLLSPIRTGAQRLTKLVADVLELSRIGREALPPEDVELEDVMEEVREALAVPISRARAVVKWKGLPRVRAHRALMRQLFQNLVENALKFRKEGAAPRVELKAEKAADGAVALSVEDNGIGFDPKNADEIFEPFKRLNSQDEYEGSGIGLATCRRIAKRYGADIKAHGAPGRGATFIVVLPSSMLARAAEKVKSTA
jgi:signal transduction histidine kinase